MTDNFYLSTLIPRNNLMKRAEALTTVSKIYVSER